MERSVVLVYKGYLIYVHQSETALELEHFWFRSRTDFCVEPVSKSKLKSKLRWEIEDFRNVVDNRNGTEAPVILASCGGKSNSEKRLRVIQTKWNGSSTIWHPTARHTDDVTDKKTGANESSKCTKSCVQLLSYMEFSCNTSACCILLHGPRVLVANQNRLLLFGLTSNLKDTNFVQSNEFFICDADSIRQTAGGASNYYNAVNGHSQPESKILSVISEEEWIVVVLQMQEKSSTSLITLALERKSDTGKFQRHILRTRDFLPQEYAPKVTSLTIDRCQRTGTVGEVDVYKNVCTVGLNDGFVMTFTDGIMQTCIMLWTHIDGVNPAFAVKHVLKFSSDVLVCHTDSKHCFIVNETAKQVIHQWDNVDKAVVGDFLHCGRQQLLLLFDSNTCVPQHPPDSYLLTDLQGFVVDRRKGDDTSLSQDGFHCQDDETSRNHQPVVNALWEQNQTLARSVAEEKRRQTSKQLFMRETLRRLQTVGLHGAEAVPDVSPPEVPLVGLVGGDHSIKPLDRRRSLTPPVCEDIQVMSVWHRFLDDVCVIGVKILNTSDRELFNCRLVLSASASSANQPTHNQQLSTTTRIWQCLHTDCPPSTLSELPSSKRPSKRHKTHPQLCVRQTKVIQPSESVTVTGILEVPDLGWFGEVIYHVDLMYMVKLQKSSVRPCSQVVCASISVSHASIGQNNLGQGGVKCGTGGNQCAEGQDTEPQRPKERGKTMSAWCGKVVLKASECLQQNEALDNLMESQESFQEVQTGGQLEEDLLALNSVQRQWLCDISFVLHEVTDVIPGCLLSAGFVFSPVLGQYLMPLATSKCLHFWRVQLVGFQPLPCRAASILVFARDRNQFLLLLRHMYNHLPDDATITLATEHQTSDIQHAAKAMSAELSERKRQARAILDGQKRSLRQNGNAALEEKIEEKNIIDVNSKSVAGVNSESEEFGEWQKLYRHSQTSFVGRDGVAKFKTAMQECEAETDMAVAKLRL